MKRFEDKTILVTGAGSGIGRATVLRFAQEGAKILAVDRDLSSAEETAALAVRSSVAATTGIAAEVEMNNNAPASGEKCKGALCGE